MKNWVAAELGAVSYLEAGPSGNNKLVEIFLRLIAELKPSIFCEIGASDGRISREVKAINPNSTVFGFEPNPVRYADNLKVNVSAGVNWVPLAVSNLSGRSILQVPTELREAYVSDGVVRSGVYREPPSSEKSSLLRRNGECLYEEIEVHTTTLDDFFAGGTNDAAVYGLWMDVEGFGWQVLSGAHSTLKKTAILLLEVETVEFWQGQRLVDENLDLLKQYDLYPFCRDKEYGESQYNILFVKKRLYEEMGSLLRSLIQDSTNRTSPLLRSKLSRKHSVPVIVPCFNNPTHSESALRQLRRGGFQDIYFVDNCSSSQPMREWLLSAEAAGVNVVRLTSNIGPVESVKYIVSEHPGWETFCVTDPDLKFNHLLPENFVDCLLDQTETHRIGKVGFSLDISRRLDFFSRKYRIGDVELTAREWEDQFWQYCVGYAQDGSPIYRAQIDTTFAVYNRKYFSFNRFLDALRVAGRFTARHLPWECFAEQCVNEKDLYSQTQKFSTYCTIK